MKRFRPAFLFSLFMLISFSDFAQTFSPSFYLDLPDKKSCYIQAQKVDKGWEVNLHEFQKDGVKDTVFVLPTVTTDTLLKIIYLKTTDLSKKEINDITFYQKEKNVVDNVLPILFHSSAADRLAGQFIVRNSVWVTVSSEKRKIKFVKSDFKALTDSQTGKTTYDENFKSLTNPEKFQPLYNIERKYKANVELTLLGPKKDPEKQDSLYTQQKKYIKTYIIDSTSFSIFPSVVKGVEVFNNKTLTDQPIGLLSVNTNIIPFGKKADSISIDIHAKSIINIDSTYKTGTSGSIILAKKVGNDSLMITLTPLIKKGKIESIEIFVKKIQIIHKEDLSYSLKKTETLTANSPDSFYILRRKKSNDISAVKVADLYSDKNFGSIMPLKNYKIEKSHTLKKNVLGSVTLREKEKAYTKLRITKIQMDIKDGFIESIKVECDKNGQTILFKNLYPIPISSKKSLDLFENYYLQSIYTDTVYQIALKDFLIYNYETKENQLDISPSDTCISYSLPANNSGVINANKEEQDKIFEYRIYTDVVGINDENPNGLIQIEGYKKINLWGRYYRFVGTKTGIGYFQHIEPGIKWSKIENNNSYLIVNSDRVIDTTTKNTIVATNHITPLELLRYQKLSVTTNFNIFKFYNDNFKMKANIDVHFGFGQTKIRDSIYAVDTLTNTIVNTQKAPKDNMASTLQMGIAVKAKFFPDARWGFDVGIRYTNILLMDATYIQTNVDTRTTYKEDKWINRAVISPEFELHKNFTNGGKFYVRYVFNAQVNKWWYNFTQFQVGYNAYVKF